MLNGHVPWSAGLRVNFLKRIHKYILNYLYSLFYFGDLTGDTAIGQGVIRFFLSTCMEKLMSGFCINFG